MVPLILSSKPFSWLFPYSLFGFWVLFIIRFWLFLLYLFFFFFFVIIDHVFDCFYEGFFCCCCLCLDHDNLLRLFLLFSCLDSCWMNRWCLCNLFVVCCFCLYCYLFGLVLVELIVFISRNQIRRCSDTRTHCSPMILVGLNFTVSRNQTRCFDSHTLHTTVCTWPSDNGCWVFLSVVWKPRHMHTNRLLSTLW